MSYEESFRPVLIIQHTGQVFPLTREPITIGRAPDNTLVLSDPQASAHHAAISWQAPNNRFVIQDLGSTNGTYLNERRISGAEVLRHRDLIRVGNTIMELDLEPVLDAAVQYAPGSPSLADEGQPTRTQGMLLAALIAVLLIGITVTCLLLATVLLMGAQRGVPTVVFQSPPDGVQVVSGNEIILQAVASGASDITLVELSVDGGLIAMASSPEAGGASSLTVSKPWIFDTPGDHRVTAVAHTAAGKKSRAESIGVTVLPRDGGGFGTATPTSLPEEPTSTPLPGETATATPELVAPQIEFFRADPATVAAGACATLQWGTVTGATEARIEPAVGGVATPGTALVCPTQTTTYLLTASGLGGVATASTTVAVGGGLADLMVESIGFNPNPPTQGGDTEVRITIRNIGAGAAPAFDWDWQAGSEALFTGRLRGLGAGQATAVTVRWAPATAYASLSTEARVDTRNEVSEADKTNNQLLAVVRVLPGVAGPGTVALSSEPGLDGYRGNDGSGSTRQDVLVGNGQIVEPSGELVWRGFMSFDLSSIPRGAALIGAELRFYQAKVGGDPYGKLGNLVLDHVDYGSSLGAGAFNTPALASTTLGARPSVSTWYAVADRTLATWVAQDLAAGRTHFQVRLRFVQEVDGDGGEDFAGIESGNNFFGTGNVPQLVVTYEP